MNMTVDGEPSEASLASHRWLSSTGGAMRLESAPKECSVSLGVR